MSIEKKLLGTTSGKSAPNVEDVFSTYLYDGTGAAQTITNGIDLAGEGGMTWIKSRDIGRWHQVIDTARGPGKHLWTHEIDAESNFNDTLTSFNSDGFSLGGHSSDSNNNNVNWSGRSYASWTFRKRERFFDIVTYTGNLTARTIPQSLGVEPGMIIIKRTDNGSGGGTWVQYHRSTHTGGGSGNTAYHSHFGGFQTAAQEGYDQFWGAGTGQDHTATDFYIAGHASINNNVNGATYVAYLFAHDPDGEDDDGMIACGSVTASSGAWTPKVTLGWEPQYILIKRSDGSGSWSIVDTMRGLTDTGYVRLDPAISGAEESLSTSTNRVWIHADGFTFDLGYYPFGSAGDYIYVAIRAPMMVEPKSGTEVFAIDQGTNSGSSTVFAYTAGFPIDMAIHTRTEANQNRYQSSRLMGGNYLLTNSSAAEASNASWTFDSNTQYFNDYAANTSYAWMFKRAKGFMDVVAYSGDNTINPKNHSLGVVPEMMIVKNRDSSHDWAVYHAAIGNTNKLYLNRTDDSTAGWWNSTTPTASEFTLSATDAVNGAYDYIAYLFATLDGVSKVGSYVGTHNTDPEQVIDCGFAAGARFVLLKDTTSASEWWVFDTVRGITSGNDPYLGLNSTSAENANLNMIDPHSSGFIAWREAVNITGHTYIFLAIA